MTKLTTRKSTSPRLTDIQLIVLSHAVQREDGAATLPGDLRKAKIEPGRGRKWERRRCCRSGRRQQRLARGAMNRIDVRPLDVL